MKVEISFIKFILVRVKFIFYFFFCESNMGVALFHLYSKSDHLSEASFIFELELNSKWTYSFCLL